MGVELFLHDNTFITHGVYAPHFEHRNSSFELFSRKQRREEGTQHVAKPQLSVCTKSCTHFYEDVSARFLNAIKTNFEL